MDIRSYTLGLFDGEGCVSAYVNHGHWTVVATLVIGSKAAVDLMKETWGGSVHVRPGTSVGGLVMCQWNASGRNAVEFFRYGAEHALVKREQMRLGLELAERIAHRHRKGRKQFGTTDYCGGR